MIFDKLKKLDIVFDSPELDCPPVFSNGDVVSGRVVLDLSGESRVDSLKLHAEGFAKVHWTESRSAGSSTAYTQNYSDEVEYLNRREVLLQAGQSAARARAGDDGGGQRGGQGSSGGLSTAETLPNVAVVCLRTLLFVVVVMHESPLSFDWKEEGGLYSLVCTQRQSHALRCKALLSWAAVYLRTSSLKANERSKLVDKHPPSPNRNLYGVVKNITCPKEERKKERKATNVAEVVCLAFFSLWKTSLL